MLQLGTQLPESFAQSAELSKTCNDILILSGQTAEYTAFMLEPGTVLQNRYRIVSQIGQGGMGAVYEAQHLELKRRVALKQMLVVGPEVSSAFRREAQLLANRDHLALSNVIDHFTDPPGQFVVTEFIPGAHLAQLLQVHLSYNTGPVIMEHCIGSASCHGTAFILTHAVRSYRSQSRQHHLDSTLVRYRHT